MVEAVLLRVKDIRNAKGMSRAQLAERVGVSPQAIWNIEEKGADPKLTLAIKIARALGVSVEELAS